MATILWASIILAYLIGGPIFLIMYAAGYFADAYSRKRFLERRMRDEEQT